MMPVFENLRRGVCLGWRSVCFGQWLVCVSARVLGCSGEFGWRAQRPALVSSLRGPLRASVLCSVAGDSVFLKSPS